MTNEQVLSFNQSVIEEFRSNKGTCGGPFEGNNMVLVTMTGATSGRQLISPLTYYPDSGDCIVMASAGGEPKHPSWYFNLVANPSIVLEVGTQRYDATATELRGDERTEMFTAMTAAMPRFAEYQAQVKREIPIFRLARS